MSQTDTNPDTIVEVTNPAPETAPTDTKETKAPRTRRPKTEITVHGDAATGKERKKRVTKVNLLAGGEAAATNDETENVISVDLTKPKPTLRSFTVISVIHEGQESDFKKGGRFLNATPAGAARKAASQACKFISAGSDDPCTITVTIREVTKNKAEKDYSYEATRKLNEKKVEFKEAGVELQFKYSMLLKSLKKNTTGQVIAIEDVKSDEATLETSA